MHERVEDYDYAYPPEAVAQEPAVRRDAARLLVCRCHALSEGDETEGRDDVVLQDGHIPDLPRWLRPGDLLVLNDTRVQPARLTGRRASSGRVSVLVLDSCGRRATVLLGTRGTIAAGEVLAIGEGAWRVTRCLGEGRFLLEAQSGPALDEILGACGRMPLPPYIRRAPDLDARDVLDRERYQTVYAREGRAAAAPTAGLHITQALLSRLEQWGVRVGRLRLDVGEGTFRPLRGETLAGHVMHAEAYDVPAALVGEFEAVRQAGGRVVAVGTTVVRALESAVDPERGTLRPGPSRTELFIRPGHRFHAVDVLLTNFHQPRSTLLVLVSAFAGRATIRAAYAAAIARGYRLFSYGDAMLLLPSDLGDAS